MKLDFETIPTVHQHQLCLLLYGYVIPVYFKSYIWYSISTFLLQIMKRIYFMKTMIFLELNEGQTIFLPFDS